ncbi:MAG: energy-coupling factor transporter transmembrane component T [Lachnospiraceae bacterium]
MQKIDPRSKIFVVASLSSLAVLYKDVLALTVILTLSTLLAYCFQVDFIRMFQKLKHLFSMLISITILQSIFTFEGNPIISIGSFHFLTDYGLIKGLEFLLRITIIMMLGCLLATSNQRDITQGLVQLKVPYEIAFMSTIGIKFLPILKEEFVDSMNAIMLRGIDIKKLKLPKKISLYTYILTPVVMNSFLRAKEMAVAMELRGFRVLPDRTNFIQLNLRKRDGVLIACSILVFAVGLLNLWV